jgi:hypothetical protein
MPRKKKSSVPDAPKPNDSWIITTELQINGRHVSPGTELKIIGERGRFRFVKQVDTGSVIWIDVYGGPKGAECIRSFYPDRIKTVHYKNKTDYHLAKEYKQKQKDKKAEMEAQDDEA